MLLAVESEVAVVEDVRGGTLDRAAAEVDQVAAVREAVAGALLERHGRMLPRSTYRLIHGELGPDHVLIDADGGFSAACCRWARLWAGRASRSAAWQPGPRSPLSGSLPHCSRQVPPNCWSP
jgi:hypothetical protein